MSQQYLTKQKLQELTEELHRLKSTDLPAIAKRIDEARENGDLSENAEYHAAREQLAWMKYREQELNQIIDHAELIEEHHTAGSGVVRLGSTVVVSLSQKEKTLTIVGIQEADPLDGRISNESPLGKALLGKRVGDVARVTVPSGVHEYTISSIE